MLLIIIIILEAMPYGIADYLAIYEDGIVNYKYRISTYSYFSPYPFLHYNVAPMISAIASTTAAIFCLLSLFARQNMIKYLKQMALCLLIATVGSTINFALAPTLVAGIVTGFLIIALLLQILVVKQSRTPE